MGRSGARGWRADRGFASLQVLGLVVVVGLVIAGVRAVGMPPRVSCGLQQAAARVGATGAGGASCGASGSTTRGQRGRTLLVGSGGVQPESWQPPWYCVVPGLQFLPACLPPLPGDPEHPWIPPSQPEPLPLPPECPGEDPAYTWQCLVGWGNQPVGVGTQVVDLGGGQEIDIDPSIASGVVTGLGPSPATHDSAVAWCDANLSACKSTVVQNARQVLAQAAALIGLPTSCLSDQDPSTGRELLALPSRITVARYAGTVAFAAGAGLGILLATKGYPYGGIATGVGLGVAALAFTRWLDRLENQGAPQGAELVAMQQAIAGLQAQVQDRQNEADAQRQMNRLLWAALAEAGQAHPQMVEAMQQGDPQQAPVAAFELAVDANDIAQAAAAGAPAPPSTCSDFSEAMQTAEEMNAAFELEEPGGVPHP